MEDTKPILNKIGGGAYSLELPISPSQYSKLKGDAYTRSEDLEVVAYIEQQLFGDTVEHVELTDKELIDIKVRIAEAFILRSELKSGKAIAQETEALLNKSILIKR